MVTKKELIEAVFAAKLSPLSSDFTQFCSAFCKEHFPHASVAEIRSKVSCFVRQTKTKFKAASNKKDTLVKKYSAWFSTAIDLPTQPSATEPSVTEPSPTKPSPAEPSLAEPSSTQPPPKKSAAKGKFYC